MNIGLFKFRLGDGMKGGTGKLFNNGETGGDGDVVGRIGLKPGNCVIFGDGRVPNGNCGMNREFGGDGLIGFNDGEFEVEPPGKLLNIGLLRPPNGGKNDGIIGFAEEPFGVFGPVPFNCGGA